MTELAFILPMPPNISNGAHGHWAARSGQRKRYQGLLDAVQGAKVVLDNGVRLMIPNPPKRPLASVRICSTMYLGAAMDDDNAMRRHKWILDWLKTRGYIVDDRKRCLTWVAFPEQIVKRDGRYRIALSLHPLTDRNP